MKYIKNCTDTFEISVLLKFSEPFKSDRKSLCLKKKNIYAVLESLKLESEIFFNSCEEMAFSCLMLSLGISYEEIFGTNPLRF